MTIHRFTAQALTPIHVGSGNEIDPLQFTIHQDQLVHFNPIDLVNRLPDNERNRFLGLLERADLRALQAFIRGHLGPETQRFTTIQASKTFRTEFEQKAGNPDRTFRVDMMPRNPHTGTVYLPGSSIKGAIRTAVVNYFTNLNPATSAEVHRQVQAVADEKKGRVLEEAALNRPDKETERDVLRLIDVEDAPLPSASTRIDRAVHFNPTKKESEGIFIWIERLKSAADGWPVPEFEVRLHIDSIAMKHPQVQAMLGRTLDLETILNACNRFYWGRMEAEGRKFDEKDQNGLSWQAIHRLFPRGKLAGADGRIFPIDPSTPYWCYQERKRMLLRLGRFSHFESLSVDKLRKGYNVQAKRPISDMGSTRTRCSIENKMLSMPFGWLMLTLQA